MSRELRDVKQLAARGKELETANPIMSYYCCMRALKIAMKLRKEGEDPTVVAEVTPLMMDLMTKLEQVKTPTFPPELKESKKECIKFTIDVFSKVDSEEKARRANKGTIAKFMIAASFFDVLKEFDPMETDNLANIDQWPGMDTSMQEMQLYCRWKATEIHKGLKMGQLPPPGPPGWSPGQTSSLEQELMGDMATGGTEPPSPAFPPGPPPGYPASPASAGFPPAPSGPPPAAFPPPPAGPPPAAFPLPQQPGFAPPAPGPQQSGGFAFAPPVTEAPSAPVAPAAPGMAAGMQMPVFPPPVTHVGLNSRSSSSQVGQASYTDVKGHTVKDYEDCTEAEELLRDASTLLEDMNHDPPQALMKLMQAQAKLMQMAQSPSFQRQQQ